MIDAVAQPSAQASAPVQAQQHATLQSVFLHEKQIPAEFGRVGELRFGKTRARVPHESTHRTRATGSKTAYHCTVTSQTLSSSTRAKDRCHWKTSTTTHRRSSKVCVWLVEWQRTRVVHALGVRASRAPRCQGRVTHVYLIVSFRSAAMRGLRLRWIGRWRSASSAAAQVHIHVHSPGSFFFPMSCSGLRDRKLTAPLQARSSAAATR